MKQQTKTKKNAEYKRQPRSRIRELTPKKVVGEAQRVIKLAADILEEEIAAGIIAAKEIEKKVINVEQIRSQDADHIMSRFRSDAHEVIDMLMDVVSAASSQLDNISSRVVSIAAIDPKSNKQQTASVPVLHCEDIIIPGSESFISMQLQNESKDNPMNISFGETDLIAPSGNRILSRNIRIKPKSLKINPGEKKEVKFIVKVPKSAKPGIYSGLVQDKNISSLQAMISLEVSK
jgi:hypothetical protein